MAWHQGMMRAKEGGGTFDNPYALGSAEAFSWYEFRWQLDYKLAWNGGQLIAIPPQNTSRTCPCCGHIAKQNRLSPLRFACVECDFNGGADVVGAINFLRAGHARLACAETSPAIGASGQEPTEVTQASRTA